MSKVLIYSQEDLDLILELEKEKNEELQQENQKLKKQQKEFVRYLEEEIEFFRTFNLESASVCKVILVYYKKIIGDDNDVKNQR